MNNRALYKAVFSQVHTDVKIRPEEYKKMKPKHIKKRAVILAAVICLIIASSATAFAANLLGLKDLVLRTKMGNTDLAAVSSEEETVEQPPVALISLQGYSDSVEYKAVAEWIEFTDNYDADGALLAQVGNGPTGLDDRYSLYLVYTQEMADKLDEITAKYNLKLHSSIDIIETKEDLYSKARTGDFLGTATTSFSAYMYEDGTFHIDGTVSLNNIPPIDYQFVDCKKGSFTDTILNIGNADSYDEWSYETSSGVTVSLSLSKEKALVFWDTDNSFITINVLAGTNLDSGGLTGENLEAFADS
ncbi:MAG: hypothetical protein VB071_12175, partial [Lawsonibacter sp.]|nr:hypothetical protein [Lawsonibacter sp.]